MTRLTKVELRRLFSRRLVLLGMLASLGVVVLALLVTWQTVEPMSAAELEQAEEMFAQEEERWETEGAQQVADCEEQEALEEEVTGQDVDWGCDQMAPQREWYVMTPPALVESLPSLLATLAAALIFLPFLIGTTFTAAEMSTGSMSNWLTFEPRRMRVYASKLVAAGLGALPMTAVALVGSVAGAWLLNERQGLAGTMTAEAWTDASWTGARILALAVVAAAVGASLGFTLRHTAAVLGLGVGYAIVVEGILASMLPSLAPWMLLLNVEGWVGQGTSYWINQCTTDATGMLCESIEHTLTFDHSAAYLLGLSAVAIAIGLILFRRRDAA